MAAAASTSNHGGQRRASCSGIVITSPLKLTNPFDVLTRNIMLVFSGGLVMVCAAPGVYEEDRERYDDEWDTLYEDGKRTPGIQIPHDWKVAPMAGLRYPPWLDAPHGHIPPPYPSTLRPSAMPNIYTGFDKKGNLPYSNGRLSHLPSSGAIT